MRSDASQPFRAAGLAVTATTLVALVAMSATMAAGPAPRALEAEARLESRVVRAMAAAVAAAARDLAGRGGVAWAGAYALTGEAELPGAPGKARPLPQGDHATAPASTRLGERLLDLPPPAC